jgi:tetratricopeptide (TPR) repeat protein
MTSAGTGLRRIAITVATLACLLTARQARGDENSELAKRHFEEGTKAFSLGEFPRAIEEYRLAYSAKPEPPILYNIAQAYRLSGDLAQALFFYRSYLHNLPDASNRSEVEGRIATIDEQIRTAKVVTTQPPNTPAPEATPSPPPATSPPPPMTNAPPTAPVVIAETKPAARPLVRRWWLWTAVGVVVAGVAVGVGVGVGHSHGPETPSSALGAARVFY